MEKWQYDKRGKALKEYLDPYSSNIGLNPDSKHKKKKTHVQPDEKDLAHRMNNNKMSTDKKGLQTIYCHVNWAAVVKLHFENVYLSH